ncbi:hypothetical protein HBI81_009990 [Parastagonospora nodorum]|nr:hypothetical protein HBH53_174550 [Parastagonospora nodorum]KAH4268468.1 hypothetical protein HBI03_057380 [Parastagonospora nodorum]KAH4278996.1 hypothetical protein HBI04_072830 [Parastagonospora nodorum]KAH4816750.1 hypothetical protein HBH61_055470 [Parastagonospora nodorum]KAH4987447.1 hypothetical protein HBI76_099190 [Parastagonospora nodorum]
MSLCRVRMHGAANCLESTSLTSPTASKHKSHTSKSPHSEPTGHATPRHHRIRNPSFLLLCTTISKPVVPERV